MNPSNSKLIDRRETAQQIHQCMRTLDNLVKAKAIACVRIGRSVRFQQSAIDEFIRSRTVNAN